MQRYLLGATAAVSRRRAGPNFFSNLARDLSGDCDSWGIDAIVIGQKNPFQHPLHVLRIDRPVV
jgi:hypothetical protein